MNDRNPEFRARILDEMRNEWYERARPFDATLPPIFPRALPLRPEHVRNAELVSDRDEALKILKKDAIAAEIGTLRGDFARKILDHCEPRHLDIIDINFSHFQHANFERELATGIVALHEGDSPMVLSTFPDNQFDWIYIDGDHSFDGVRRDAEVAAQKVRQDGILIFNDYIFFSYFELEPYGIVQVVNDMCVNQGWEVVYFALAFNMYCDIAIRRRSTNN